jgi:anti-anti-sigma regulatory factor
MILVSDFNIRFERKSGALQISLTGDFDALAAGVLYDALKRNCGNEGKIFVDTSGLKRVHTSGRDLFQIRLSDLKEKSASVVFRGRNRAKLVLEEI